MKISLDKKYKTRGGEDVVLYCVDAPTPYCVHGRIETGVLSWKEDGCYNDAPKHILDLIEVEEEQSLWVNVYEANHGLKMGNCYEFCETNAQSIYASRSTTLTTVARLNLKFKRGDGLTREEIERMGK